MGRYYSSNFYDNNDGIIVSTKHIFEKYQNDNEGTRTFPEYMEKKFDNGDYTTLDSYKDVILDQIQYYADRIEYHIDEMRSSLDNLEEVLDYEEEPDLRWEMVEVLE